MSRKSLLAATALVALIAAAPTARAELELTLNFPVAVGGPITAIIDGYAKAYSEETEGVTILPVYTGSYQDTITRTVTAFKGGNAPDMAVLLAVDGHVPLDPGDLEVGRHRGDAGGHVVMLTAVALHRLVVGVGEGCPAPLGAGRDRAAL